MQLFAGVTLPIVNQVMALLWILFGVYTTIMAFLFVFSLYLPDYLSYGVTTRDCLVLHGNSSWTAWTALVINSWEFGIDRVIRHPQFATGEHVIVYFPQRGTFHRVCVIRFDPATQTYDVNHHRFGRTTLSVTFVVASSSVRGWV